LTVASVLESQIFVWMLELKAKHDVAPSLRKAMRRRVVISGIAGSIVAWLLAAHAQQQKVPIRIGSNGW
jgi:hypothetical protein